MSEQNFFSESFLYEQSFTAIGRVNERCALEEIYKENPTNNVRYRVDELSMNYDSWRKIRGDGNCYYRAVAYSYLENLIRSKHSDLLNYIKLLEDAKDLYKIDVKYRVLR